MDAVRISLHYQPKPMPTSFLLAIFFEVWGSNSIIEEDAIGLEWLLWSRKCHRPVMLTTQKRGTAAWFQGV